MLELLDDTFEIACDNCTGNFITSSDKVTAANNEAKMNGWKIKKKGKELFHFCPDCANEL